jgi:hypothetical protein
MGKNYSAPELSAQQQAALEAGAFDYLLPDEKPLYSVKDAAGALGIARDSVQQLIANGQLEAHIYTLVTRPTYVVTRRSLRVYLAATSTYGE